jgi:hypothetical protein
LRSAVLVQGAQLLEGVLKGLGCGRRPEKVVCACGTPMESRGLKTKEILTILGPVSYARSLFACPACNAVRYPGDEALGVVNTTRSPGVRRMMARAGSQAPFRESRDDLRIYAGIEVSAKDVERVAEKIGQEMEVWQGEEAFPQVQNEIPVLYVSYDGTGVPMTREELQGRKGKQSDGSSRTREAKIGCVFTQTKTNEEGFPIRDPESTTFVGAIETAEIFGSRIFREALRRGLDQAKRVVVLGDGAEWIKNLADFYFPEATTIVDLYHAREHVVQLCKYLFVNEKGVDRHRVRWWAHLDRGKVEKIISEARKVLPEDPDTRKKANTEINYLQKNKGRMRYSDFRAEGLFVGSGVVEAGCKTVIGQRLKQSGMEWSLRGANAIIALRCVMKSNRFEDYWESRAA